MKIVVVLTHTKIIVACFRKGNKQGMPEFDATTRKLFDMTDWLKDSGCKMAALENTASYWNPLYNILESSGPNAVVVNALNMNTLPGRTTAVKDAEWITEPFSAWAALAQLHP